MFLLKITRDFTVCRDCKRDGGDLWVGQVTL